QHSLGISRGGDVIDGGKGNDTIAGNQFYAHTIGADVGISNFLSYGYSAVDDVIDGGDGNDDIVGDQATAITEGDGADIIGGNDSIAGGKRNDSLLGHR